MELVSKNFVQQLKSTCKWLLENSPQDVLMILKKKTKAPAYSHKNGDWSWERLGKALKVQKEAYNVGILLRTILVLDFDDTEEVERWMSRYEFLSECPVQQTSKGLHFFMRRTPLCDELALYDKARCFSIDGQVVDVDLKTLCKTGTSGVISVAPSDGKKWLKSLEDHVLPDIPEKFARTLADMYHKPVISKAHLVSRLAQPVSENANLVPSMQILRLLEAAGFYSLAILSKTANGFSFDANRTLGLREQCPLCLQEHTNNNWWCCVHQESASNTKLIVKNYSERCKLSIIDDKANFSRIGQYHQIDIENYHCSKVGTFPLAGHDVFFEQSLPGTGKTLELNNSYKQISEQLDIPVGNLYIVQMSCRKVMALNKKEEANEEVTYELYSDLVSSDFDVRDANHLMIEIESIWRLEGGKTPDVLILDEFESLVSLFQSTTMKRKKQCQEQFRRLLISSRFVIGLDAYFTDRGLKVIDDLFGSIRDTVPRKALLRINTFQAFDRKALEIPGASPKTLKENFVKTIAKLLKLGKKVVVAGGTKAVCDRVYQHVILKEKMSIRFKYYNKDSTKEDLEDFKNPDKSWQDLNLLMFTGLLTVAVSYNLHTFDTCVVYADSSGGPVVRDLYQMLHRVRNYTDNNMYYALNTLRIGTKLPTSREDIIQDKESMREIVMQFWDGVSLEAPPRWLMDLTVGNVQEENESRMLLRKVFDYYMKKNGYRKSVYDLDISGEVDVSALTIVAKEDCEYTNLEPISDFRCFKALLYQYYNGETCRLRSARLQRYVFDNKLSDGEGNVAQRSRVFNRMRNDGKYARIFFNIYHELNHEAEDVLGMELSRTYVQLMDARAMKLQGIAAICRLLAIENTCQENVVWNASIFKTRDREFCSIMSKLSQCGLATRNKSETNLQESVAIKNRLSSLFSHEWCGRKIAGKGKRINTKVQGQKRAKDYEQFTLQTSSEIKDIFDIVKCESDKHCHSAAHIAYEEVVSIFGEVAV